MLIKLNLSFFVAFSLFSAQNLHKKHACLGYSTQNVFLQNMAKYFHVTTIVSNLWNILLPVQPNLRVFMGYNCTGVKGTVGHFGKCLQRVTWSMPDSFNILQEYIKPISCADASYTFIVVYSIYLTLFCFPSQG